MSYREDVENTKHDEFESISDQLTDIKETIKFLADKAIALIPAGIDRKRAECYWYAHLVMSLGDNNMFMGGSVIHMQDSIDKQIEVEEEVVYTPKAHRD